MSYQHKNLAAGQWNKLSLLEQMANIGSEVERALKWQKKNNVPYSEQSAFRALELTDLTLNSVKGFSRLKEVARLREAIVDYFFGLNQFMSSEKSWRQYFSNLTYAARRTH